MSAGCTTNKAGDVTFACPVFSGTFQLAETDVVCHIGNKGSSSLTPRLLSPAP